MISQLFTFKWISFYRFAHILCLYITKIKETRFK